ncbi:MAG: histidine--tRNA ligase, partial [Acidobacteria bacterium]
MTSRPHFSAPKGTRDLLPDDADEVLQFEGEFSALARLYGFSPLVTPAFEHTEVFERGVGEATDIVNKEMYTFADRGDRSMTLRPEGTAPVMRAFIEHGIGKSGQLPWKVFYLGPMWRYERPQAGRMREFRQVGAESIGSADPQYDVELVDLVARFFDRLQISDVELLINSMGDEQCRPAYSKAFASFVAGAVEKRHPLCDDCTRRLRQNPLRIFDCKKPGCRELTEGAPTAVESLCADCIEHFEAVKSGLRAIGVSFRLEPRLVRGLDYYTR